MHRKVGIIKENDMTVNYFL